jgi:transposase
MRSAVERFFGWIKSFRRIVVRYERLESTYKALTTIASIIIHLRYGI